MEISKDGGGDFRNLVVFFRGGGSFTSRSAGRRNSSNWFKFSHPPGKSPKPILFPQNFDDGSRVGLLFCNNPKSKP